MKLLLDTHALIWWFSDDSALTRITREAIADASSAVFVSPVSAYEMALKSQLGRLPHVSTLLEHFAGYLSRYDFRTMPIDLEHARFAGELPLTHRDPFDRLLIAQARLEQALLVSSETLFDDFGVTRLW